MHQFALIKQSFKNLITKDFVSIRPESNIKGNVLVSYVLEPFIPKPFFLKQKQNISDSHTNQWECRQIVKTFLDHGYWVDIINWNNTKFIPKKKYEYFIDIHSNLERISPYLNKECIKILHITGAHWLFQNKAEYSRLLALQQRRSVTLKPRRLVQPCSGIENADFATILGNKFTIDTFSYAKKPIHRIPISTTVLYNRPEFKDYEACKNRYLWLGSSGMVHKGLDLVLEAFAQMPKYHLTVCGPIKDEEDFEAEYCKELNQTPNIHTIGWIDTASPRFLNILENSIGIVYPSCSEGGGGSVITCMHAGLIPIISYESSVDVNGFGIILKENSIDEIKSSIKSISNSPTDELILRSMKTWEFARENHTRDKFSKAYQDFVTNILNA
jgi:glycosyltransferase involved in cell wall biosynthesis